MSTAQGPHRARLLAVLALPLLPLLMGAADHAVELSGSTGSYRFGSCQLSRSDYTEASVRYTVPVDDNFAFRVEGGGAVEKVSDNTTSRLPIAGDGTPAPTPPVPQQTVGWMRAQVLADIEWAGAGFGVVGYLGPKPRFMQDTSLPVIPCAQLRLGPRQIHARLDLLNGGLTGTAYQVMGLGLGFDLPLADVLEPGLPHVEGMMGMEFVGQSDYVTVGARLALESFSLLFSGRFSPSDSADRSVTMGLGIPLDSFTR
ncbi:MAG: hypothetical protein ACOYOB_14155 [Myxococcota bacterium]